MTTAVLLVAHGSVDSLDDLPEFLTNIRRGHAPDTVLLNEVRRRYEAIGGKSPLNAINAELASKLADRLGLDVKHANRLFRPDPKTVLEELVARGARRVIVVPLAQHSAAVYAEAVRRAARDVKQEPEVVSANNWGRRADLTAAFAESIVTALDAVPHEHRARTAIVITAHSLPMNVIASGDAYESEFRGSADDVTATLRKDGREFAEATVAFQSQGLSGGNWLGPDLRSTFEAVRARGARHVLVAPIGFLADHVEILYDLDIEAAGWARELGLTLHRSASLNASDRFVDVLASLVADVRGER